MSLHTYFRIGGTSQGFLTEWQDAFTKTLIDVYDVVESRTVEPLGFLALCDVFGCSSVRLIWLAVRFDFGK